MSSTFFSPYLPSFKRQKIRVPMRVVNKGMNAVAYLMNSGSCYSNLTLVVIINMISPATIFSKLPVVAYTIAPYSPSGPIKSATTLNAMQI